MIINPYSFATGGPPAPPFGVTTWSKYEQATAATTHSIPTPAGVVVGDLLILMTKQNSSVVGISRTGWTEITGAFMRGRWKIAEAGDDAATLDFELLAARQVEAFMLRISGARAVAPFASAQTTFSYDPPNLSPGWGTGDFLGITFIGNTRVSSEITAGPTPPTTPSGFSGGDIQPAIDSGSTVPAWLAFAWGIFPGISSINPNAWAVTTAANSNHGALTILVRP